MGQIAGMKVLVVGASSGIGRAIAGVLAAEGAAVAISARRHEALLDLAASLPGEPVVVPCDVRRPESCEATVDTAATSLGGLDALVYCAGVSPLRALADADADLWHEVLETNLIGASLVCRSALPHLRQSRGRVVFLGSSSVGRPFPGLTPYAVSKAGLEELVRGWRAENPHLSFSTVVVGPTDGTEFATAWNADLAARMFPFWEEHGYLTAGAAMTPDDIGRTVCDVLASTSSVWTTWVQGHSWDARPLL
jgi:NAD(P)-dependent dehydrogenase (short-subunit alcohol dehydrogenase family)